MEDADLLGLELEQNFSAISRILRRFVENNAQTMTFDDLKKNGKRQKLFMIIFRHLNNQEAHMCHRDCLDSLRVLSRDKTELNEMMDEGRVSTLLRLSRIFTLEETTLKAEESINTDITVAALKVLCNQVYNSPVVLAHVAASHAVEGILMRLRMYREPGVPDQVKLFDMKLLFIISALAPEIRPKMKEDYHGLVYLTETLDLILKESSPCSEDSHRVVLTDGDVDLCCEILKVLFNLISKRVETAEDDGETVYLRLTSVVHDLLLSETAPGRRDGLTTHCVNLLTSVPSNCYTEVTTPAHADLPKELDFEGRDMTAVEVLITFLERRLTSEERSMSKQELLSPILTVLVQLARLERCVRKHLRYRILPPLRDVLSRPEEGDTLRARLCRLLTSPSIAVKNLTAELLFTLCKENVGRMVKYTGYGNAAGLFASRGLLLGARKTDSSSSYSSDSDSDTEEYAKFADQINPVVGCYEPPRADPLAGMTDEQKEYEMVRLANLMDKLQRSGVIQPCRVNEDGRPEPIEHVLQLQEDVARPQGKRPAKSRPE